MLTLLLLSACTGPVGDTDPGDPLTRELSPQVILGEGGFFGVAGRPAGTRAGFAVGGHYAGGDQAGRVYLFDGVPGSAADAVEVLEVPDGVPAGLGWAMAAPCDLDEDGASDLVVGQHLYVDPAAPNCGRVLVFLGSGTTVQLDLPPDIRAQADVLGQTVTCADLDGDGHDDVVATGQNAGADDTGVAAVWWGTGAAPASLPDVVLVPEEPERQQYLGAATVVGDLDADGDPDLAVGAWGLLDGDGVHTGGVAVWDEAEGPPDAALFPASGEVQAGQSLAWVPEHDRLVVGSNGVLYVYGTGVAGWEAAVPLQELSVDLGPDAGLGGAVLWAPQWVSAGEGALLAGARHAADGSGVVVVWTFADGAFGEPEVLAAPDGLTSFGMALMGLGDVDGDGLEDYGVGVPEHIEGEVQTGGVVLYR